MNYIKNFFTYHPLLRLLKRIYNGSPRNGERCTVCQIEFGQINEEIRQLPCCHYFHKDCISQWLQFSKTCPICRYVLDDHLQIQFDCLIYSTVTWLLVVLLKKMEIAQQIITAMAALNYFIAAFVVFMAFKYFFPRALRTFELYRNPDRFFDDDDDDDEQIARMIHNNSKL